MYTNKQIIGLCPNFYKIIEFSPYEDDIISKKLIKLYQEYIFRIDINNPDDVESVINLDKVVSKYIDDYLFRKELQRGCVNIKIDSSEDITTGLIEGIFNLYDNYENGYTRNIYFARWI